MFLDRGREVVISGAAGTGKSRACLEKLHYFAQRHNGARILIVRKTRESLNESALVTLERDVFQSGAPMLSGARRETRSSYVYPNGSEIIIAGLKQSGRDNKAKVMSTDYDMIFAQEATELSLEEWEKLTTRLRNFKMPFQQIIGDCNPDTPTHWLYARSHTPRMNFYQSIHEDNPKLHNGDTWTMEGEAYIRTLDELTGLRRQRFLLGEWAQATGQVYETWSAGNDGNVQETADYTEDGGPILWGIDDGYSGHYDSDIGTYTAGSHPRVFLLAQMRSNGTLVIFNEDYAVKLLPEEHIDRVSKMPYPEPEFSVVDRSAAELKGRLHNRGIYTRRGAYDVEASIGILQAMVGVDLNGVRRLKVHPRCAHLIKEFTSYRRDDFTGKPVKEFDHGLDALRYLAWAVRYERD